MRSRRCRRIGRRSPPRRCSCSRSTRHCKRRSRCRNRRSRRCCSMISIRRSRPWSRAMRRPRRRSQACGAAGSGSLDDHAAHGKRANPMKGLRWRVLLVLSLAAVVPTVIVGMLAILRARRDVQDEVQRGALAGKDPVVDRALASTVEGTLSQNGMVSAYRNLSSYQSLRGVRWAIIHQQPEDQAYALARTSTRVSLVIGIIALALALAFGAYFATRLTRPLADLARRADAIAAGQSTEGPPVHGPGEIGELAKAIDEMAKRIAERAELAAALARGDRLASVGVMSAQVAHEINNPLTTVLGYAKLLLEAKPEGHPDRNALELIADEAERMKKIIGSLLEYARAPRQSEPATQPATGSIAMGSSEPSAVVRHVAALVAPQLRRAKASLQAGVAAQRTVSLAAQALQEVLVNLVQNAAQAGATHIAIATKPAPGEIATIITVSDDGPGIPAAARARVFDPIFTTTAPGPGTGLGLAVCKHLVAGAGGTIEVGEAADSRGAEFRVTIPVA